MIKQLVTIKTEKEYYAGVPISCGECLFRYTKCGSEGSCVVHEDGYVLSYVFINSKKEK